MGRNRFNMLDCIFDFIERYYFIFLIAILSMTLFNLFYCLKDTPIYSWDEARHGINAYEMLRKHEYIINTYGYKNDYWNLKPPMSFWAIMIGYKLAGFNPLGLRLVSAISAFLTIIISALFIRHKHGKLASLICILILTTSPKYIVIHSARTGDSDSLLVLFYTISMLSMILIERNRKFLYLAGLGFSFAFLTKSWHALNVALVGFIYLLLTKILFKIKIKEWLLFSMSSIGPILLWGILRYNKDGLEFFKMMINYDLLARSSQTLEGHIGDQWFYFGVLKSYYSIWLLLLAVSLAGYLLIHIDVLYKNKFKIEEKNYAIGIILWFLIPILTYSKAKTKIAWYILPLYIPVAISISALCHKLIREERRNIAIQLILLVFIVKGVSSYEPVIKVHIEAFKNDNKRTIINKIETTRDIKGANTYIYYGENANINVGPISEMKSWQQSDMLAAELYWDLVPMDGGLEAFLKDKSNNSIIIIPKEEISSNTIIENRLNIISKSGDIYILNRDSEGI